MAHSAWTTDECSRGEPSETDPECRVIVCVWCLSLLRSSNQTHTTNQTNTDRRAWEADGLVQGPAEGAGCTKVKQPRYG